MVGACKIFHANPRSQAFAPYQRLTNLRQAHRRSVLGSGIRAGSLQRGAACSHPAPSVQTASQACCRQRRLKGAEGASQSGKIVKVRPQERQTPRRTQIDSC